MANPAAPLLLVYDAESGSCRGLVDWVQARDRDCRVVTFPFQNAELVRVAPEVAGLPFDDEIHGLDTRTRKVYQGVALLPAVFRRLPAWSWLAPWVGLPLIAPLVYAWLRRTR